MQQFYDEVNFHANTDHNFKQLLQARAENMSYSQMMSEQNANPSRAKEGRLAFCMAGLKEGMFAFGDGTKWVFIGDTSINYGSLYKPKPARVISTSNIALSGLQTIDSVTVESGDLVLVTGQSSKSLNGVYVAGSGTWQRHEDTNEWEKLVSAMVVVEQGEQYKDTQWMCIADRSGTLEEDILEWIQIPLINDIEARNGLTRSGNILDVNPDTTNNTTKINASNEVEVKINPTGAIGTTTTGIKVNVDNSTVGINASNQLYAKNGFKAFHTFFNAGSPNIVTDLSGGFVNDGATIIVKHDLGVIPLLIQFHSGDATKYGGELYNVIYPKINNITSTDLSVTFLINDVASDGTVTSSIPTKNVHVSVIGQGTV